MVKKRKPSATQVLLVVSFILNVVLISLFFVKLSPHIKSLEEKIKDIQLNKDECRKVYSQSQKKFICMTRSVSLQECSKSSLEAVAEVISEGKYSDAQIEKLREFSMRVCMESNGYEY